MRMMLRLGAGFALCTLLADAVEWKNFQRQGHVNDFAGVVDVTSKRQLESYCDAVERTTGVRLDFVTIPTLEQEPAPDVARAFASAWGNQGVLVLLSTRERTTRVEILPRAAGLFSARARDGMLWVMGPSLREGRYGDAFLEAAESLGSSVSRSTRTPAPLGPSRRRTPWTSLVPWTAVMSALALAVLMIVLIRRANRKRERAYGGRTTWGSRGSGGFGGFDSADSFGGFGGDSGRAGASSDW